MKPRPALLAAALTVALVSGRARAAQMVVVDADYTHGPQTTKDSHFYVVLPPGTPSNWQSPVNYAGGQAVVELEVKTKPSDAATRFQVCFISKPDYSCTDQSPVYTKTGTVTWATPFSEFYIGNDGSVDWSQSFKDISLILKDTNNVKPAPENVGTETSARYMPTDLHVIVTIVPEGETYVPPSPSGGASSAGGNGGAAGNGGANGGSELGGTAGSLAAGGSGGAAAAGAATAGSSAMQPDPSAHAGATMSSGGAPLLGAAPVAPGEGCGCRMPRSSGEAPALALTAGLVAALRRRRRAR